MRDQLTVCVEHVALDESERAPGVLDEGTRRDAARADRPKEVHLHLHGRIAFALAERRHVGPTHRGVGDRGKNPPCTVPIGFPCAAVASSWTSASPAANETSR